MIDAWTPVQSGWLWAAVTAVGVGGLLAAYRHEMGRWLSPALGLASLPFPRLRFYRLRRDILALMEGYDALGKGGTLPDALWAKSIKLMWDLDGLNVAYPNPPKNDARPWWNWLPRLYEFSAKGNLAAARKDRVVWEKELGPSPAAPRSNLKENQ